MRTVAAALTPPSTRLTGVGTVTATAPIVGEVDSPLAVTIALGLVPTADPNPLVPAELTLAAPPHVELSGNAALFGAILNAAVSSFLGDFILALMRPIVRQQIHDHAVRALSLAGLPPNVTLSIRPLAVTPTTVTFQPVLGALGNVLSTYQPAAAAVLVP